MKKVPVVLVCLRGIALDSALPAKQSILCSVVDRVADPDWIRIQPGQWIWIRIQEGKNDPKKNVVFDPKKI